MSRAGEDRLRFTITCELPGNLLSFIVEYTTVYMSAKSGDQDIWGLSNEQLEQLDELSPSAKFVYAVLETNGTLDQDEIANRTRLPKRTIRYALDKLESAGLVENGPSVEDARRRHYCAKTNDRQRQF